MGSKEKMQVTNLCPHTNPKKVHFKLRQGLKPSSFIDSNTSSFKQTHLKIKKKKNVTLVIAEERESQKWKKIWKKLEWKKTWKKIEWKKE